MDNREEDIFMAKLAEKAERFDHMLHTMKKVASYGTELTVEEVGLLETAIKNAVRPLRTAWEAVCYAEKKEAQNSMNLQLVQEYKKTTGEEYSTFCNDVITLINDKLNPSAKSPGAVVNYLKLKGEYYHQSSRCSSGEARKKALDLALETYKLASEKAIDVLKATHPTRLGLALDLAAFHYEVYQDNSKASQVAKQALDKALEISDEIEEDQYHESTSAMQLLRDNIILWDSDDA